MIVLYYNMLGSQYITLLVRTTLFLPFWVATLPKQYSSYFHASKINRQRLLWRFHFKKKDTRTPASISI